MNEPAKPFSESVHEAADAIAAAGAVVGSAAVGLEHAAEQALENELVRHPRWRRAVAVFSWLLVAVYFLFAITILGLRYWFLPNVAQYTGTIEQKVSEAVGARVTIGSITAGWDGLRPQLELMDLRIHDKDGLQALSLPAVEAVLSWRSVLQGSVHFHSLALERPDLAVSRDASGALSIAGLRLDNAASSPGLSDWLLAQRELSVRDARIVWNDGLRAAPPLELSGVNLLLRSSGDTHRFALSAAVSRDLASKLDVRGDLVGNSLAQLDEWRGSLYAELDYINLAAWRKWLDYPLEVRSGDGGLRLWVSFAQKKLTEFTADVALAHVATRTAASLPLLELDYLRGRLGAKETAAVTDVFGRQVALRTSGGIALPPAEFALHLEHGATSGTTASIMAGKLLGEKGGPRGEFSADALDLQPLAQLAEFLPFPAAVRKRLADTDPRGSLHELKANWQGDAEQPDSYSIKGRFKMLSARANANVPGFSGLSGSINATEKNGSISLESEKATIELPGFFPEDRLAVDALKGQVGWILQPDKVEVKWTNLATANADAAAVFSGSYATKPGSPGVIDFNAIFSRADARQTWRYIPHLPPALTAYLKGAILAGTSRDLQIHLKGDLANFPFESPAQGKFQIAGRFVDGELNYVDGWPRAAAISGDLSFDGNRMQIRAQKANMLGTRLSNVRAVIPDLFHRSEMLSIEGQAEGPSSEFLRFIEASPVTRYIDGATQDMRAAGNGRLALKLDLPIRKPEAVKVAGNYQFQGNQFTFDPELPPVTQMSGRLDFTEAGVAMRGVTGQFLGGPVNFTARTRADGTVVVGAGGTATAPALRRLLNQAVLDRATGAAPWRAAVTVRRGVMDLVVDSTLQGVAIDLPQPFGKTAPESLPFHLERTNGSDADTLRRFRGLRAPARGDLVLLTLGTVPGRSSSTLLARRAEGKGFVIDRGVVALNEAASVPAQPGVLVSGSMAYADLDRWQAALAASTGSTAVAGPGPATGPAPVPTTATAAAATSSLPAVTGVNLKVTTLDIAGKRINDVAVRAVPRNGQWTVNVDSREVKGEIQWRSTGRGVVQARLSHLITPEDRPAVAGAPPPEVLRELPALDVVAENFTLHDKPLGRLELVAVNDARDWRIQKLVLSSPDGTLNADGVWQSWAARPSISVNLKLETSDLGKYLDRMGYPRIMQRGTAKLEGKVGWAGSPQSPDLPTLTGDLTLSADKGQFLKADPGVAKLLGVLSLQSLVTLDLRDLFREGFSYDTITGTASISKGVMTTKDFFMKGASAQVRIAGGVDLVRETQNLHLRVVPSLGDGASTITSVLMANPLLGITATLLQRLLKDPLGQIFAVEYDVTGGWNDPKVARTKVDAPKEQVQQ